MFLLRPDGPAKTGPPQCVTIPREEKRKEPLVRQAKDYALHIMRTTGSVPATVIVDTDKGYIFTMLSALADEAAKDHFAEGAHLFEVAHNARAKPIP